MYYTTKIAICQGGKEIFFIFPVFDSFIGLTQSFVFGILISGRIRLYGFVPLKKGKKKQNPIYFFPQICYNEKKEFGKGVFL